MISLHLLKESIDIVVVIPWMLVMRRDLDLKADSLDVDVDVFGVPGDVVAAEDPLEMVEFLSFFVLGDKGAA